MKKLIFIFISVGLFATEYYKNDLKFLNSDNFQQKLDKRIEKVEKNYYKDQKAKEQLKLLTKLNENAKKLPPQKLAQNFVKILNLTKNTQIDPKTTFAKATLEGKNIVLEYYIKDNEKMRNRFKDEKFKNTILKSLEYTHNRLDCHKDNISDTLMENGYGVVYRYKFLSTKEKIVEAHVNKQTCKKYNRW